MLDNLPQTLLGALFGACLGSYFGCAWWRIPRHISLFGESRCPSCGRHVPAYFNLPLISFIMLRGRTRCCSTRLARRYLVAEGLSFVAGGMIGAWVTSLPIGIAIVVAAIIVPFIASFVTGWDRSMGDVVMPTAPSSPGPANDVETSEGDKHHSEEAGGIS